MLLRAEKLPCNALMCYLSSNNAEPVKERLKGFIFISQQIKELREESITF